MDYLPPFSQGLISPTMLRLPPLGSPQPLGPPPHPAPQPITKHLSKISRAQDIRVQKDYLKLTFFSKSAINKVEIKLCYLFTFVIICNTIENIQKCECVPKSMTAEMLQRPPTLREWWAHVHAAHANGTAHMHGLAGHSHGTISSPPVKPERLGNSQPEDTKFSTLLSF